MSLRLRTGIFVGVFVDAVTVSLCSDGDTVEIRAGADGVGLNIHDNHIVDERDDTPAVQECR